MSQFQVGDRVRWSPKHQHMKNVPTRSPTEAEVKAGVTIADMPVYGEGPFTVKAETTLGGRPGVVLEEIKRPGFASALFELAPADAAAEAIAAE